MTWTSTFLVVSTLTTTSLHHSTAFPTPAKADASAHFVHNSRDNDWMQGSYSLGKAGAEAYIGQEGVGAMAKATLGEIGGKIGPGPVSIGGRLGLSADTGLRLGPDFEAKVLGTGLSVGGNRGLEVCLFGTCLSMG